MNTFDPATLAQLLIEDRIRESNHQHLVRGLQRHERPATTQTVVPQPRSHSRLWSLLHFRQAYT